MLNKLLYKPKECAELFDVSLQTIYNWIKKKLLKCIRPDGEIYIRCTDIEEFLHLPASALQNI